VAEMRTPGTNDDGQFELSPPDERGRIRLVAAAPTVVTLLTVGLKGFLTVLQFGSLPSCRSNGLSVSIHAEAGSIGELFAGLAMDVLDKMEAHEIAVAGVTVDGLARSEIGHVAWGRLEISAGKHPVIGTVSLAAAPVVEHAASQYTIDVTLMRSSS
jgi:hypothetical protein